MWIGNHPDTTLTHNVPNPPDGWTKESLAELSEYERDSVYGRAALETIRDRPGTFLINGVKKTVLVYANDTAPISGFVHAELSDVLSSRAVLTVLVAVFNGYYWSLLALGAIGWLCLILRKRLPVALLGSAPAIVAGIACVHCGGTVSLVRYAFVGDTQRCGSVLVLEVVIVTARRTDKLVTAGRM